MLAQGSLDGFKMLKGYQFKLPGLPKTSKVMLSENCKYMDRYRFCFPLVFGRTICTGGGLGIGPDFWSAVMNASNVSSSSAT